MIGQVSDENVVERSKIVQFGGEHKLKTRGYDDTTEQRNKRSCRVINVGSFTAADAREG